MSDILNETAHIGGVIPSTMPLSSGNGIRVDYGDNELTFDDLFETDEDASDATETKKSKKSKSGDPIKADDNPPEPKKSLGGTDSVSSSSSEPLASMSGADSAKEMTSDDIELQDVGSEGLTDIKVLDDTTKTVSEMFDLSGVKSTINEAMDIELDDEDENDDDDDDDDDEDKIEEGAASAFVGSFDELLNHVASKPQEFAWQMIKHLQDNGQGLDGEDRDAVFKNATKVVENTIKYLRSVFQNNSDMTESYGETGEMDMNEHRMNGSELAMTTDLAIAMFKSIRDQAPDDDTIGSIARGLAMCCDGEDVALGVEDKDKIDAAMAKAYSSENSTEMSDDEPVDDMSGEEDGDLTDDELMSISDDDDIDTDVGYEAPEGDGDLTDEEDDEARIKLMSTNEDLTEGWDVDAITSRAFHY